MNDDPLLNGDNLRVDFNEAPSPPGIEQAIKEPIIKEQRPAGMGSTSSPKPQERQLGQQEKQRVESKRYEIDGTGITVNYETLRPTEESVRKRQIARELKDIERKQYKPAIPEGETNEAVIFLPGWSLDAGTKSAREVGQAFADAGGRKVFVVDAKPDKVVDDTLYKEAGAISRLVEESGVKKITISGYSEGGIRAVDLAVILQKHYPDIVVDGVVLMESAGLYDQGSKKGFVGNFVKDTVVTPINLLQGDGTTLATGLKAGTDVLFGMLKEIGRTNRHYPERVRSQIREMVNTQTHLGEVKAPVILVQGVEDLVSNPEKIIPGYKDLDDKTLGYGKSEPGPEGKKSERLSHALYNPLREEFLQENLFPESPYVRMVTGEKLSHHAIPILRARQVATDSLYLIERFKREQVPVQPQTTASNSAV